MSSRVLLRRLFRAALAGADPEAAVRRALERPDVARALASARTVGIFAVGKAAASMTRGARSAGAKRALVVLPFGHSRKGLRGCEVAWGSHPEPDRSSERAAKRAIAFFRRFGPADVILCLVSGGTSSLLALPRAGLSLARKRRAVRALVESGASILEVNRLRTSLSAVKGGRLGEVTRARLVTLVLSDVPGDRPSVVGSGPTVRGRRGDLVRIVGSNGSGLDAAAKAARRYGYAVRREKRRLSGEARAAGLRLARLARRLPAGGVLLAGGETVVTLSRRHGRGGRSLELALAASPVLAGTDLALLAAGSDGRDGSSRAAGAFVDGRTLARARRRGVEPDEVLRRHDSRTFFAASGGLFVTGPTEGNVGDWVFVVRNPRRPGPV
jgi:hydroxypyruvate reductase